MTIPIVLIIVMVVLFACGIYLMLERSMTRVLVGFLLAGNGTNLLILMMSGNFGRAPILVDGELVEPISDPLPQAFILTAIVITFGVSAFLMALIYRSWRLGKVDTVQDDAADIAVATKRPSLAEAHADELETSDTEFGDDHDIAERDPANRPAHSEGDAR